MILLFPILCFSSTLFASSEQTSLASFPLVLSVISQAAESNPQYYPILPVLLLLCVDTVPQALI